MEFIEAESIACSKLASRVEQFLLACKVGFRFQIRIWCTVKDDNNIGGRCRTILIDRNNPEVVYAAGVSGGIFKSTNGTASWSAS